MYYIEQVLTHYGWEGIALAGMLLLMLCVQLYYYIFLYGVIPSYKANRRALRLETPPALSVIIPMFSEDYSFVEERLPLILAQEAAEFEVVIVYVGSDTDFFEDLARLRLSFPQIVVTKIELNPRFPISTKMALNVGIKSAHHEHILFSTTDVYPVSDHWLSLVAKGFTRGEVVLGYCGLEPSAGLKSHLMQMSRMMQSADWLASAACSRPYRGIRHCVGLTKSIYFGANGFDHLNMNVGEDDLFLQRVMVRDNVAIVLSPRATLREHCWGGWHWWNDRLYYAGATIAFYPLWVRNHLQWEVGSHLFFFAGVVCALSVMPLEYKLGALFLLLLRYTVVALEVNRIAKRLGEESHWYTYFLYDLLRPFHAVWMSLRLLRKDPRVWR
ncbi:MAG: glycosyltransferase [Alistipes sp.]